MSQAQIASIAVSPVRKPKRPRKTTANHPKFLDMVREAIVTLKERNGSSRQAISKAILAKYPSVNPDRMNSHIRKALRRGLETGALTRPARSSATGATGRFKLGAVKAAKSATKKAAKKRPTKKTSVKKAAKPKAKTVKSPRKRKVSGKKKPASKKVTKAKTKKATSPKKKAKPASKKVAKKPKAKKTQTSKAAKK